MSTVEHRIQEVATWILKVNPQFEANYFRSESIRPVNPPHPGERVRLVGPADVTRLIKVRQQKLQDSGVPLVSLAEAMACGRLVYARPIDSTLDGGAELYSQCLLDIWEVPAWDTWLTYNAEEFPDFVAYQDCLISWIPNSVVDLFYSGLSVCLENNLGWITVVPKTSCLFDWVGEPADLNFIEDFNQDEVERRSILISGKQLANENAQLLVDAGKPGSPTLWAKIKRWFA